MGAATTHVPPKRGLAIESGWGASAGATSLSFVSTRLQSSDLLQNPTRQELLDSFAFDKILDFEVCDMDSFYLLTFVAFNLIIMCDCLLLLF